MDLSINEVVRPISSLVGKPEENTKKKNFNEGLKTLGEYNREVTKELPKAMFKREPMRLKYGVLFSVLIIFCLYSVLALSPAWYLKLPISILMGLFLAGNTFLDCPQIWIIEKLYGFKTEENARIKMGNAAEEAAHHALVNQI